MQIKIFNTLSKEIEEFKPIKKEYVSIYSCGPTVYNYAHIGNMRSFLFADLLYRVLKTVGDYDIKWVMNITDIDDKTIRDSNPKNGNWLDAMKKSSNDPFENIRNFTEFYIDSFIDDIQKVGIDTNNIFEFPRATDHIEEMIELIKLIYNNGYAYIADNNIYFNVSKWKEYKQYGRLKNIDFDNFKKGVRIDADEYEREEVSDFVLWKNKKEEEPFWDFELDGNKLSGRPGWHLECSAMEKKFFDLPFDIHTGGIDLQFPHHEDEIAQSHAGYGIDPTVYWCHCEFLEVEGKKMSKSYGNYYTIRDLEEKGFDTLDIRFSIISQHYRTKYNFTFDGITAASKGRKRVQDFIYSLLNQSEGDEDCDVNALKEKIYSNLANDLHTPKALAEIFTFINSNKNKLFNNKSKNELLELFKKLNNIFNIWKFEIKSESIPSEIIKLADDRVEAKKSKNYSLADELRNKIIELGYSIKDTKESYELTKD